MKVLQLVTSFPPAYAYGGPVESAYNLSKQLVDSGHEVTVFTTDVKDANSRLEDYRNPEFRDGIRVFRFRNISNRLAWSANVSTAIGMWPTVRRKISEYDVVHLHEYRSIEAAIVGYEAERQAVPVVLQPRGSAPRTSKSRQKALFDRLFGETIFDATDHVVCSSEVEVEQITREFPRVERIPISKIPNGIGQEEYSNLPEEGAFRSKHGMPRDDDLILYLGRIHQRKGIDNLIRAFERVGREERSLVVVGPDDGYLADLRDLQDRLDLDDISFPGPLYGRAKLAAYNDADVFVLPSKNEYESFGNVVIESMACGTPTVSTTVCGVSEWIDHPNCSSVPPDPDAIGRGIEAVLRRPTDPSSLREYVRENFTWGSVAARTESVYTEIAG